MPMEISPNLVGARLKPYSAQIHWRDTMNYAAAIFDSNPLFFDDERNGGVLVHPMFSVAVTLMFGVDSNFDHFIQTTKHTKILTNFISCHFVCFVVINILYDLHWPILEPSPDVLILRSRPRVCTNYSGAD